MRIFSPLIDRIWLAERGETLQEFKEKLEQLASAIARWGSKTFGHVRSELRRLKRRLVELKSDPGRSGPSYEELKVQERIVELNFREEIMWRQRSRIQWLAEGNGNTKKKFTKKRL